MRLYYYLFIATTLVILLIIWSQGRYFRRAIVVTPTISSTTLPSSLFSPTDTPVSSKATPLPSQSVIKPLQTLSPRSVAVSTNFLTIMKDVGEPIYDYFGLTDSDFREIKSAQFDVIAVNFDICASDEDVNYLLEGAKKYGLKVFLPAGSGEAEWGYECESSSPSTQGPVWQKDKVQAWVKKWKDHPAVYGWDSSNEDGENLPNGSNNPSLGEGWTKFSLTSEQLATAYRDIKAVDPIHPIMIRMNGFWFYENEDNFFRAGNHFAAKAADIVMVNTYSNIFDSPNNQFVGQTIDKSLRAIKTVDSDVKVIASIASWEEKPTWHRPTGGELTIDINQVLNRKGKLGGLAYFKYGAKAGVEWHMPSQAKGSPELWQIIKDTNNSLKQLL